MHRIILDEMPEQSFQITDLPNGYQQVELYRNVTEIQVDGQTKYEADYLKLIYPSIKKMTAKDFETQEQIDFIFGEVEKKEKQEQKKQLIQQLNKIDAQTIRPLRAKEAGTQTQADIDKLNELEAKAAVVRNKIQELGA